MAEIQRRLSKDGSVHVTDEVFNTFSSGVAAVFSILGVVFLLHHSWTAHKPWHFLGFGVYGFGLVTLFVLSTLHHGINASPRTEHLLRQLDYFAIFFMIAGTMTPFCTILLRGTLRGEIILAALWGLAMIGIVLKGFFPNVPRWFTTALYVGMGWVGIGIFPPVYQWLGWEAILWILIGGLFYTIGSIVYLLEKPNPFPGRLGFHEIWHCFVIAGAASHFGLIYFYLLPY